MVHIDTTFIPALARESGVSDNISSLDDCGLRYTLAARHHVYLMNTVTLKDRAKLQHSGLTPAISIWAFHSESLEVSFFMQCTPLILYY